MSSDQSIQPARVFCSYSHRDDESRRELEVHLSSLIRQNLITFWYDRRIKPGDEWKVEIARELEEADIILLLISAYFISSNYCYRIEMGRALERHREGSAMVIPIYVRSCDWEGEPFGDLQGLPPDAVPVHEHPSQDAAWTKVAKGIRNARNELAKPRTLPPSSSGPGVDAIHYERNSYLRHLIESFSRLPWVSRAIELYVRIDGEPKIANSALLHWSGRGSRIFLLSGAPGSGKTSTFRQFAADLARDAQGMSARGPLPLYIPLRTIQEFEPVAFLNSTVPESNILVRDALAGGETILLLDGIDEVGPDRLQRMETFLLGLIESVPSNSRFAISGRPPHVTWLRAHLQRSGYEVTSCTLEDVSVSEALHFVDDSDPTLYRLLADGELARQPIVLGMLEDAVYQLKSQERISILDIYEVAGRILIRSATERSLTLKDRPYIVVYSLLKELAAQMFPHGSVDLNRFRTNVFDHAEMLDAINALTSSRLLSLDANETLTFSHVSWFEYFFASLLHTEIDSWNAFHLSRINLIYSYNVNRFLVPMLLRRKAAPGLRAERLRAQRLKDFQYDEHGSITRFVYASDFMEFMHDTGWRKATGFGQWLTLETPDGTSMASDSSISLEATTFAGPHPMFNEPGKPALSLSWYDANQFAFWLGGRLPTVAELRDLHGEHAPELEWTSEWFDEQRSMMSVSSTRTHECIGVNPDVRSPRIGFRVVFDKAPV